MWMGIRCSKGIAESKHSIGPPEEGGLFLADQCFALFAIERFCFSIFIFCRRIPLVVNRSFPLCFFVSFVVQAFASLSTTLFSSITSSGHSGQLLIQHTMP